MYVLHIQPWEDSRSLAEATEIQNDDHLVAQTLKIAYVPLVGRRLALTLRLKADQVLADMELNKAFDVKDRDSALEVRLEILYSVLSGLNALHSANRLHGDLRPSNISFDKRRRLWALMDWGSSVPAEWVRADERELVVTDEDPSFAADVYAFGKLAQRMLGTYRWDNRDLPAKYPRLRSEQFEWILDFCTTVKPHDRPSVDVLVDVLFGDAHATALEAARRASQAADWTIGFLAQHTGLPRRAAAVVVESASTRLNQLTERFPETQIALLPEFRAERLLFHLCLDILDEDDHNTQHKSKLNRPDVVKVDKELLLRKKIDAVWRDRLHRLHFSKALDPLHEERMAQLEAQGDPLPGRASYLAHIEASNIARRGLITANSFLYTAEVAELLSTDTRPVSEADVTVLRRWGQILAVPDHGRWLHPTFQFDLERHRPSPLILEVSDYFNDADDKWGELAWWGVGRTYLGGRALSAVLMTKSASRAVVRALDVLND